MAVVLRMKKFGTKKQLSFRVVAMEKTKRRDGRVLEEMGSYSPKKKSDNFHLKPERIKYWLSVGAQPSATVERFIKKMNIAQ